jgi:hypothetical protein
MIADKKSTRSKGLQTPAEEARIKSQDELDAKSKMIREKIKEKRVNYIVKDLPIY